MRRSKRGEPVSNPSRRLWGHAILWVLLLTAFLGGDAWGARLNDTFLERIGKVAVQDDGSFSFAYIGDVQLNFGIFKDGLKKMAADPEIAFLVVGGDMMDHSSDKGYRAFLKRIEGVRFPVAALPGNHDVWKDRGALRFEKYIGDGVTHFVVGRTLFILLHNTSGNIPPEVDRRFSELLAHCRTDADIRHLFVCMHVPPFDPRTDAPGHSMNAKSAGAFFAKLTPLATEERTVTVFASHVHGCFFRRHGPVRIVVSGGGGGMLYGKGEEFFHHYMKVNVRGDALEFHPVRLEKQRRGS